MRRYGVASGPRWRATPNSESFREQGAFRPPRRASWSRRRGRDTSEKAKNIERKLNYEKSENYVYDGPVRACLLWALPTTAKRHRHTRSRCETYKQHGGWAKCSSEYHDRSLQFSIWFRLTPEPTAQAASTQVSVRGPSSLTTETQVCQRELTIRPLAQGRY